LHHSGSLRISDFGSAQSFDLTTNPHALVSNTVGTIAFWPPESLISPTSADLPSQDCGDLDDEDEPILEFSAFSSDLWAAGCSLHCFLYQQLPFSITGCTVTDLISRIIDFSSLLSSTPPRPAIEALSSHSAVEWSPHCSYSDYSEDINLTWGGLLLNSAEERWSLQRLFQESNWVRSEMNRREKEEEAGQGTEKPGTVE
jgi:hypothetical protein